LVHHKQPPSTPLCRFFQDSVTKHVTPTDIRTALRRSLAALGPAKLGIRPDELEARSLRAGGATLLLCATVDQNSIQLLGRWKSDAMIRYLHISVNPHVQQYAKRMYTSGHSSFNPGTNIQSTNPPEHFSPPRKSFYSSPTKQISNFRQAKYFYPKSRIRHLFFFPWIFGRRGRKTRDLQQVSWMGG
jgi:hypothetical protein